MRRTYPNPLARQVAKTIREYGWCQGQFSDSRGRVCLYGAIDATFPRPAQKNQHRAIEAALRQRVRYGMIGDWNDQSDRTVDQVLDLLATIPAEVGQDAS